MQKTTPLVKAALVFALGGWFDVYDNNLKVAFIKAAPCWGGFVYGNYNINQSLGE